MKKTIATLLFLTSINLFAQNNEVKIGMPNVKILYTGYNNLIEVCFGKEPIKDITLECLGCDTIRKLDNRENQWLIRMDSIGLCTLYAKTANGKLLNELILNSILPPPPIVYLDSLDSQNILIKTPEIISLKLHKSVPLNIHFDIRKWKITIGKKEYKGIGRQVSIEAQKAFKRKKSGFAILEIDYFDVYGTKYIKEIVDFKIKKL